MRLAAFAPHAHGGLPVGALLAGPWGVAQPTAAAARRVGLSAQDTQMSPQAAKVFAEQVAGTE